MPAPIPYAETRHTGPETSKPDSRLISGFTSLEWRRYSGIYALSRPSRAEGTSGTGVISQRFIKPPNSHGNIATFTRLVIHESDQMYVYPPLIAVLYIPLTYLSLSSAALVMLFVTAFILLGSVFLGAREMLDRLGHSTL